MILQANISKVTLSWTFQIVDDGVHASCSSTSYTWVKVGRAIYSKKEERTIKVVSSGILIYVLGRFQQPKQEVHLQQRP